MSELAGGCLCGAVRYRSTGAAIDAGYCHCRLCQRASGAPLVAWVSVPAVGFRFTQGEPQAFASSAQGIRHFCPTCGTPLTFRRPGGAEVDITVATLDAPEVAPPEYHVWTPSQLPWLHLSDDLPRYEDDGPDR